MEQEILCHIKKGDVPGIREILLRSNSLKELFLFFIDLVKSSEYVDLLQDFLEIFTEKKFLLGNSDKNLLVTVFYYQARAQLLRDRSDLFYKNISLLCRLLSVPIAEKNPVVSLTHPRDDFQIFQDILYPYLSPDSHLLRILEDNVFKPVWRRDYALCISFVYLYKNSPDTGKISIHIKEALSPSFIQGIWNMNKSMVLHTSVRESALRAFKASITFLKKLGFPEDILFRSRVEWSLPDEMPCEHIQGSSLGLALTAGIISCFLGIPECILNKFIFTGDISSEGNIGAITGFKEKLIVTENGSLVCPEDNWNRFHIEYGSEIADRFGNSVFPVRNLEALFSFLLEKPPEFTTAGFYGSVINLIFKEASIEEPGVKDIISDVAYMLSLNKHKELSYDVFSLETKDILPRLTGIFKEVNGRITLCRDYLIELLAPISPHYRSPDFLDEYIPKKFIGREKLIGVITDAINRREIVILRGLCNIGKTSLANKAIMKLLEDKRFLSHQVFYYCFKEETTGDFQNFIINFTRHLYFISPSELTKSLLTELETNEPDKSLIFKIADIINKIDCIIFLDDFHLFSNSSGKNPDLLFQLIRGMKNKRLIVASRTDMDFFNDLEDFSVKNIELKGFEEDDLTDYGEKLKDVLLEAFKGYPPVIDILSNLLKENYDLPYEELTDSDLQGKIKRLHREIFKILKRKPEALELFKFLSLARGSFEKGAFNFCKINKRENAEFLINWHFVSEMKRGFYKINEIVKVSIRDYPDFLDNDELLSLHSYWAGEYYKDTTRPDHIIEKLYHLVRAKRYEDAWKILVLNNEYLYRNGMNFTFVFNELKVNYKGADRHNLYGLMGIHIQRSGETMDKAIENLKKALESDNLSLEERIRYQNEMSYGLYRLGKFREALEIGEKSLETLKKSGDNDSELSGDTCHLLAKIKNKLDDETVLDTFEEAKKIYEGTGNLNKIFEINNSIAVYFENRGCPSKGIPYCKNSIAHFEGTGESNLPEIARCYGIMSRLLFLMGKFQEAIDYKEKDLEIVKKLGDKREISKLYNEIADCYLLMEDFDEVRKYLELAEKPYNENNDNFGKAHLYNIKAKFLIKENRLDEALSLCEQAINIYTGMNLQLNIQEVNITKSRIYRIKGDLKEAERLLEEALNLLSKFKYEAGIINYELAFVCSEIKEVDSSYQYKTDKYLTQGKDIFSEMCNTYWIKELEKLNR